MSHHLVAKRAMLSIAFAGAIAIASTAPAHAGGNAGALLAYGKVGGLIPVGELDPNFSVRLGFGYVLPVLGSRLALVADLGYSQASLEATVTDPRLGVDGGQASFSLTQQDLNLFFGPQGYFLDPYGRWVPYAAAGVDLHFLRSQTEGSALGQSIGDNEETSTKVGFALRAGLGFRLGPGLITGELSFAWAPIDHEITGESHLGRLALLVGYTAMLGL